MVDLPEPRGPVTEFLLDALTARVTRLPVGPATGFFDEHVMADAVHESIAAIDLAGGLAKQDPRLERDILWGAAALIELEGRFARHLLASWEAGESSLIEPPAAVAGSAASRAAPAR